MTTKAKFYRKGHIIREFLSDDKYIDHVYMDRNNAKYPSINEAKRQSRTFQIANGGLGMGSLRVVEKLPEVNHG